MKTLRTPSTLIGVDSPILRRHPSASSATHPRSANCDSKTTGPEATRQSAILSQRDAQRKRTVVLVTLKPTELYHLARRRPPRQAPHRPYVRKSPRLTKRLSSTLQIRSGQKPRRKKNLDSRLLHLDVNPHHHCYLVALCLPMTSDRIGFIFAGPRWHCDCDYR